MTGAYQYEVKFWCQDFKTKFWKQDSELLYLDNKNSHWHAEKIVKRKWKRDFNQDIKIITVYCD